MKRQSNKRSNKLFHILVSRRLFSGASSFFFCYNLLLVGPVAPFYCCFSRCLSRSRTNEPSSGSMRSAFILLWGIKRLKPLKDGRGWGRAEGKTASVFPFAPKRSEGPNQDFVYRRRRYRSRRIRSKREKESLFCC